MTTAPAVRAAAKMIGSSAFRARVRERVAPRHQSRRAASARGRAIVGHPTRRPKRGRSCARTTRRGWDDRGGDWRSEGRPTHRRLRDPAAPQRLAQVKDRRPRDRGHRCHVALRCRRAGKGSAGTLRTFNPDPYSYQLRPCPARYAGSSERAPRGATSKCLVGEDGASPAGRSDVRVSERALMVNTERF